MVSLKKMFLELHESCVNSCTTSISRVLIALIFWMTLEPVQIQIGKLQMAESKEKNISV
jgi:hypothetical protein